ncbi:MAG: ABC transporter substrate-binding protein [Candidatus Binataceae bacterium]|nr:ABC transporter substrate-binding protein [Candidatus Binataceae bacterium]
MTSYRRRPHPENDRPARPRHVAARPSRLARYAIALATAAWLVAATPHGVAYADPPSAIAGAPGEAINDPMRLVQGGVGEVIAVFNDKQMALRDRREKLRTLAGKYFDFESMARSVMGYHWRELTAAQRAQFVPLFASFIQDAYLSKLQDYTVQKVQQELLTVKVQFTHETFEDADYAQVFSNINVTEQKDAIPVNYLMHLSHGEWKIYDVTVDAISVIANYRNQFNRVMNTGGFDKLVADLNLKLAGLQNDLENPPARHE